MKRHHRNSGLESSGFTLVELLIVLIVTPIIVGAIAVALLATLRVQSGVTDRLSASNDTQVVSANFFKDVQSATDVFAPTSLLTVYPQCGTTAPVLSLRWPQAVGLSPYNVVTYSIAPNGFLRPGVAQYALVRSYCTDVALTAVAPSVPINSTIVAGNVPMNLTAMVCVPGDPTCSPATSGASTGWVSTANIENIEIVVNQAASNPTNSNYNFSFTLVATPRVSGLGSSACIACYAQIAPLELLSTSASLSTCSSSAPLNINGPMLFNGGIGTSGKPTISTSSVYWYGTAPSTSQFVKSDSAPFYPPFTKLLQPYVDQLQNLPIPDTSALPLDPPSVGGQYQPGVYDYTIGSANLSPGVYIFTGSGAGIDLKAGDTLNGQGVLLYFTNSASMTFASNSVVDLSPATSGSYGGVTIWQDESDAVPALVTGSANTSGLSGIVYLPGATLTLKGGPNFFASNLVTQDVVCKGGGGGSINLNYGYVPQTLPSLSFKSTIPSKATVGQSVTVSASSTNKKGLPVTLSVDGTSTTVCSLSGNTVTFNSPGTCTIDADQLGSVVTTGVTTTYYFAAYELQGHTTVSGG